MDVWHGSEAVGVTRPIRVVRAIRPTRVAPATRPTRVVRAIRPTRARAARSASESLNLFGARARIDCRARDRTTIARPVRRRSSFDHEHGRLYGPWRRTGSRIRSLSLPHAPWLA